MRPFHVPLTLSPAVFLAALLPAQEKPYSLEMRDHVIRLSVENESGIPLEEFIKIGERVTGRAFTFDQQAVNESSIRFEGTIQVAPEEFFAFFQTLLYVEGYACILRGEGDEELVEVVRMQGTRSRRDRTRKEPVYVPAAELDPYAGLEDATILTAIPLEHVPVREATEALRPFVNGGGLTLGNVGNSRSILLQGPGPRVYLASRVIDLLDVPEPQKSEIRVVRLEHFDAEELGGILGDLFATRRPDIEIASDGDATLIVRAEDRETIAAVLDVIALIDR